MPLATSATVPAPAGPRRIPPARLRLTTTGAGSIPRPPSSDSSNGSAGCTTCAGSRLTGSPPAGPDPNPPFHHPSKETP